MTRNRFVVNEYIVIYFVHTRIIVGTVINVKKVYNMRSNKNNNRIIGRGTVNIKKIKCAVKDEIKIIFSVKFYFISIHGNCLKIFQIKKKNFKLSYY